MVAIAFAAVAPALGLAGAGATTAGIVVGVGIGLLATYIDTTVTYPALFGKKSTRPDAIEGFQISTTDPGSPRWEVYGGRAWVPCHYLWSLNYREEVSGNGQQGKGGRPFVQTMRADIGIATCDGPIAGIEAIYANERPMWLRQPNNVLIEEHRLTITAGTGGEAGLLIIQGTDADVQDFSALLEGGDKTEFIRLERVTPTSLQGYYRTIAVTPHSGSARTRLSLRPLQGQTPTTGSAGSMFEPAGIRRIDQGAASHEWGASGGVNKTLTTSGSLAPGIGSLSIESERRRWVAGSIYRWTGWNAGRWKLTSFSYLGGVTATSSWSWEAQPGAVTTDPAPTGTSTLPLIIVREEGGGLMFSDPAQTWVDYNGSQEQPVDPTLAASVSNPGAHRGIAHISFGNLNLGPHGNSAPVGLSALVKSRSGETVAAAINRICRRTMPEGLVDVSRLRAKMLHGYSIPGGMTSGQALQPVASFYGIAMQERGGVLTFLDDRDLPVVPVATRHLNARPTTEGTQIVGFTTNAIEEADIPERVQIMYVSPTGENEMEADGQRAPGSSVQRGGRDTLQLNLRPLVAWGYEVKRRARELKRRVIVETERGKLTLGPGYLDVLPATCMTFVANNWHEEYGTPDTTIFQFTEMRDLLPRSIAVRVQFVDGRQATLTDDGLGALGGFPAGITASVNAINYTTGRIDLTCSVALDSTTPSLIGYRYHKQWLVRASKATLNGYDFGVAAEVVTTTLDDPLPPVPRDLPTGIGPALTTETPIYRTDVIDTVALFPGMLRAVRFGIVAAPEPGAVWRGAVVYQSPNGEDRWTPIEQIQEPAIIGSVVSNTLPAWDEGAGYFPGNIDWETELEVFLPGDEILNSATTEEISNGANWMIVGNELMAFHEAEAGTGSTWILRGLARGMRHTFRDMDGHADGERVIILSSQAVVWHEPIGGFSAAGRTYHLRIVPGGASVDQVATKSFFVRGRSAIPAPPIISDSMIRQESYGLVATWERRSIDQTSVFGPSPLQAGEYERFRVYAFDYVEATTLISGGTPVEQALEATKTQTWEVGDQQMGTPYARRQVTYKTADYLAHGYAVGDEVGFAVWQIGAAGKSDLSEIAKIEIA